MSEDDVIKVALYVAIGHIRQTDCELNWTTVDGLVKRWMPEIKKNLEQGYIVGWGTDGFPWNKAVDSKTRPTDN